MHLALNRSQLIRTFQKSRHKSQKKYGLLPVYVQNVENQKKYLVKSSQESLEKTKLQPLVSSRTKQKPQKQKILSRFNSTFASTFNQTKRISHRIMSSDEKFHSTYRSSSLNQQTDEITHRPSTQFKTHRNFEIKQRFLAYTPLQVINTKLSQDKMQQKYSNVSSSQIFTKYQKSNSVGLDRLSLSSQNTRSKKNFLKKGSSFDRTLLHNILKSKLKQKLVHTTSNYSNHISNTLLHSKIKPQIPNQFRDVIGPEEMIRMSRILSGINIKPVDLNDKIQQSISKRLIRSKLKTTDSGNDDLQTLKSIKRW